MSEQCGFVGGSESAPDICSACGEHWDHEAHRERRYAKSRIDQSPWVYMCGECAEMLGEQHKAWCRRKGEVTPADAPPPTERRRLQGVLQVFPEQIAEAYENYCLGELDRTGQPVSAWSEIKERLAALGIWPQIGLARCSGCKEPVGSQHLSSCYLQGRVTVDSDSLDRPQADSRRPDLTET